MSKRRKSHKRFAKVTKPPTRQKWRGRKSPLSKSTDEVYAKEIANQDDDFPTLCRRHHYQLRYLPELVDLAGDLKAEFDSEISKPGFVSQAITDQERVDLTQETVFTIDGDDAKDFDDAVSLTKENDRYHLGVHIADVSHFIKENSPLDQEALRRGTSVYLINRVLPMFPEPISNHLCSLVEGEYRYTYSCFMEIDREGEIRNFQFRRSVIKSVRRCTYLEVEDVLQGRSSLNPKIDAVLKSMDELKTILRERRVARGSINFSTDEQIFSLSSERVESVKLKSSLSSENLIEEFMLAANVCAAKVLNQYGAGIYRVHDLPRTEKLHSFERAMAQLGFKMPKAGTLNPLKEKGMNRYVIFLEGIEDAHVKSNLSFLLLISMNQAEYSADNIGHYGLAFPDYTHFTSPIRRYPDLAVHRLITDYYKSRSRPPEKPSGKGKKKKNHPMKEVKARLKKIAKLSSENERKAVEAEREYNKVKGMRFLSQFPDKVYETMVMKTAENGMFVKELETGIEGFVSVYDMDPDLFFDQAREVYKRKKEIVYELGSRLQVRLSHLNFNKLFIDFKPV